MKQITLLLVHIGSAALPSHLKEALINVSRFKAATQVVLLANECHRAAFEKIVQSIRPDLVTRIHFVAVETIPISATTRSFTKTSKLDQKFRNGFWFNASYRFYAIADYMEHSNAEDCLHIETDVVLYFDPFTKLERFRSFADFAVPLDRIRAIPGVVWFQNAKVSRKLADYMLTHKNLDDMATLGHFLLSHPNDARALPSIPEGFAAKHQLDMNRYCEGLDLFGGVFDCAAIGQYVGGIHWMNDPEDTRFFINESSDLDLSRIRFFWKNTGAGREPVLGYEGVDVPVLSIHAHSKDLAGVSPFNSMDSLTMEEVITGERIQSLADLTITTNKIDKFHQFPRQQGLQLLEIPEKKILNFFKKSNEELLPPDEQFIQTCDGAKTIFMYTHLLPYFKKYVAPRLKSDFVLLTHNSDDPVDETHLELLNHPHLVMWFAQNVEFSHSKLCALPIGMANSQWGTEKIKQLVHVSKTSAKKKLIYSNFNPGTHPARVQAFDQIKLLPFVTMQQDVGFEQYITELAAHKFCICPRGNGIDTHRFWEAQYLDCIPVILAADWTAAYSGLPVVTIKSWVDLDETKLEEAYLRISTTSYDRKWAKLSFIKDSIQQAS